MNEKNNGNPTFIDSDANIIRIISIWDNGGVSLDRYTIIFEIYDNQCNVWGKWLDKSDSQKNLVCLSLSDNPEQPQGFSQFGSCIEGDHLGTKIKWPQLSKNIQQHIKQRLEL